MLVALLTLVIGHRIISEDHDTPEDDNPWCSFPHPKHHWSARQTTTSYLDQTAFRNAIVDEFDECDAIHYAGEAMASPAMTSADIANGMLSLFFICAILTTPDDQENFVQSKTPPAPSRSSSAEPPTEPIQEVHTTDVAGGATASSVDPDTLKAIIRGMRPNSIIGKTCRKALCVDTEHKYCTSVHYQQPPGSL